MKERKKKIQPKTVKKHGLKKIKMKAPKNEMGNFKKWT